MAQRAERSANRLEVGPGVLKGIVAPGVEPAVRVEIEQDGVEAKTKSSDGPGYWRHRWRERGRRVTVRPFDLILPTGDQVRVFPDEHVQLVDALDEKVFHNRRKRTLVAELSPCGNVIVTGELQQRAAGGEGYRESKLRWVLVPPRRGRILLSSEPLAAQYRAWVRPMLTFFGGGFAVVALVQGLTAMFASYIARHDPTTVGYGVFGVVLNAVFLVLLYVSFARTVPRQWWRGKPVSSLHHGQLPG